MFSRLEYLTKRYSSGEKDVEIAIAFADATNTFLNVVRDQKNRNLPFVDYPCNGLLIGRHIKTFKRMCADRRKTNIERRKNSYQGWIP